LRVANDRTEASVGKIGRRSRSATKARQIAIGRTSRSAIKGLGLDGSRAFSATDRTDASVGVCYEKVEREKLGGCDDDRSGRFDGG
jgi:hypothetical protein